MTDRQVGLLMYSSGRPDYLDATLRSMVRTLDHLDQIAHRVFVDDSGDSMVNDPTHQKLVDFMRRLGFHVLAPLPRRRGFAGAIQAGWNRLRDLGATHVLHLEDDFTFNDRVDLVGMLDLVDANPYLAQVALLRQPITPDEIAAGGIMQMWPDEYVDCFNGEVDPWVYWTQHRLFFTTNPSVYRADLIKVGWPQHPQSERAFTDKLLADGFDGVTGEDLRFAFWGHRDDPPRVTHIGHDRQHGTGY